MARRAVRGLLVFVLLGLLMPGLAGCAPGGTETAGSYKIAGGVKTGLYYTFAEQIAQATSDRLDFTLSVEQTQGSVDNLQRVASGEALVGFAQGDTAADAIDGTGAFESPMPIRAVARVYDEYVHIVVPTDSAIEHVTDLAGHTVSQGAEGSGVQVIAQRVIEAAGLEPADVTGPALGLDTSLAALTAGEIDAFFWVGGLPTPGIERMTEELPIRLLDIEPDLIERVNEGHAGVYRTAETPANNYGIDRITNTMTVPNYLVAAEAAPPAAIRNLVRALFETRTEIAAQVPIAALLDRREAIFTEPVPLHPGAAEYYRDVRL